jgi:hypothetical protein
MKFSMTEEKGDLSIQVTEWAGLTVYKCRYQGNISIQRLFLKV